MDGCFRSPPAALAAISSITSAIPQAQSYFQGNVGIGTASPGRLLDVGGVTRMRDTHYYGSSDEIGMISWRSMGGGVGFGMIAMAGRSLSFGANESWDHMVINTSGNVGVGTTSPSHKLTVNGSIKAEEVVVEAGIAASDITIQPKVWADDVFAPEYALPTVNEVAAHIEREGHLPGVSSAATVAGQGVVVGEMQATLLRKIEELTLYLIRQERRLNDQQEQILDLQRENAALRSIEQ